MDAPRSGFDQLRAVGLDAVLAILLLKVAGAEVRAPTALTPELEEDHQRHRGRRCPARA
jgi:hypothetical protein